MIKKDYIRMETDFFHAENLANKIGNYLWLNDNILYLWTGNKWQLAKGDEPEENELDKFIERIRPKNPRVPRPSTKVKNEARKLAIALCEEQPELSGNYLCFLNQVHNLSTGETVSRLKEHLTHQVIPWDLKQIDNEKLREATKFYLSTLSEDPTAPVKILRLFMSSILRHNSSNVIFNIYGDSGSGKSTLREAVISFAGVENSTTISPQKLSGRFDLEDLIHKTLNATAETSDSPLTPEQVANLKQLSGSEMISTDRKFHKRQRFYSTAQLLFVGNAPLRFDGSNQRAISDRIIEVKMDKHFRGDKESQESTTHLFREALPQYHFEHDENELLSYLKTTEFKNEIFRLSKFLKVLTSKNTIPSPALPNQFSPFQLEYFDKKLESKELDLMNQPHSQEPKQESQPDSLNPNPFY